MSYHPIDTKRKRQRGGPKPGQPKKLTPEIRLAISKLALTETTGEAITNAINRDFGVNISRSAVAGVLRETKHERADIAKNVLREQLSGSLIGDLEVLLESRQELERTRKYFYSRFEVAADTNDEPEARANAREHRAATGALKDIIQTRLHYSGAGEPDSPSDEAHAAAERVRRRLAGLAARGGGDGEAGGDSADPV